MPVPINSFDKIPATEPNYRNVCLEDLLEDDDNKNTKNNKYNKNHSNNNTVSKNQQEFGHRKRIKP